VNAGLLAAVAAGVAVLALACGPVLPRPVADPGNTAPIEDQAVLRRIRVPLAALAALSGWTVLGGWVGTVVGIAAGAVGWRILDRVESPAVARRRVLVEQDLPIAVQLLGACLAAGAAPANAVLVVAEALAGPIGDELRQTHHRLVLGVDPVAVWQTVDGPLLPLGRTMVRAYESGASVRVAIEALAGDVRSDARLRVESLARSVEVRASAPLGVCFLPAFVLLGVVPMVVGIFSSLKLFG
jgi:Flp pilus assembly protein TadB